LFGDDPSLRSQWTPNWLNYALPSTLAIWADHHTNAVPAIQTFFGEIHLSARMKVDPLKSTINCIPVTNDD